jgi:hypothetical protein
MLANGLIVPGGNPLGLHLNRDHGTHFKRAWVRFNYQHVFNTSKLNNKSRDESFQNGKKYLVLSG